MQIRLFTLGTVMAIVFAMNGVVQAQGRSGGSSAFGSSFGSSGAGSSGFGGSGFGGSGMGSSGFGSSGFGGGMGDSGFGSSGFGGSGMGNSGFGNSSFGNSGFGNSGYGGQNGSQNFVGRTASDMQGTFGQMNKASTQFFNNMNRQMSRNNSRKGTKTISNPAQPMRMEVRVAFDAPRPGSDVVSNTLRLRLAKILADHHMTQPVVTVQGDTAVLSGAAASDSERQVIAQLVSMEAGVRSVRNEMTVVGAASEIVPAPGS